MVFGSVARGDFHDGSDIDVLVVATQLPARALDRLAAVGLPPTGVQPVVWSPQDWSAELARGNPVATEAVDHGVWLHGDPRELADESAAG
ncbi:MAG: nucleotidyltransferase domain-containing protein [Actinomycetota bacterium]|nr:nucleotidyltransferase domain-containing protein [Actinomycetota bacterium]